MAYDPLAPYVPLGTVFTTDHVTHLDNGIKTVEAKADQALSGTGIVVTEDPNVPGTALIGE